MTFGNQFPRPVAFAHRGAHDGGRRENSLAAFMSALARGAMVESDVRLSLGGVPVLAHDSLAFRHGLPVMPAITPVRLLRRLGVPALADLLDAVGTGVHVCLDLKVTKSWPAVLRVATDAGASRRVWLVHDDLDLLRMIRAADADIRLVHEARPEDLEALGWSLDDHPGRLAAAGIDAQNTTAMAWTERLVENAHAAGILAFGSLVQDPTAMAHAASVGLDAAFSDHVDRLVATFAEASSARRS